MRRRGGNHHPSLRRDLKERAEGSLKLKRDGSQRPSVEIYRNDFLH